MVEMLTKFCICSVKLLIAFMSRIIIKTRYQSIVVVIWKFWEKCENIKLIKWYYTIPKMYNKNTKAAFV